MHLLKRHSTWHICYNVGRKKYSVSTRTSDWKAALRFAVKWGYLDKAPDVELIRSPERAVPFFTLDDLDKLLAAATKDWVRRFILFAFSTGMRRTEIIYLKRSNIDLARRLAYVLNTDEFTTKSRRERIVPLNATAYAIAREGDGEYLFVDEKGRWVTPNRITCAVKGAIRAAGLDDRLHLHSLRHTFCTVLVQAGASFQEVQKLAGRSTVAVTQLCNHMVSETLHCAVQKLDRPRAPRSLAYVTDSQAHSAEAPEASNNHY